MQNTLDIILSIFLYLFAGGGLLSAYSLYLYHYEGVRGGEVGTDGILWILLFWPVLLAFMWLILIIRLSLWILIKTEQARDYARGWVVQK